MPELPAEETRSRQIEEIISGNWNRFKEWQQTSGVHNALNVPQEVADVFIPQRILEIAKDPSSVHVRIFENEPFNLRFMVLEDFDKPVSDPNAYSKWQQEHPERHDGVVNLDSLIESTPDGVDPKHIFYYNLVEKGKLSLNEKFYLDFSIDARVPPVVPPYPYIAETRNLYDRSELNGRGIGGSFYGRVEDVLKQLGFKYLTGWVISKNPGFFAKTRIPYAELPVDIKKELPEEYDNDPQRWMVKEL